MIKLAEVLFCGAILGLVGCQVVPNVKYDKVEAQDYNGLKKFAIASSVIVINPSVDAEGTPNGGLNVTAAPIEWNGGGSSLYSIAEVQKPGVSTRINLVPRENTMLIQSIGTEVEDSRLKYISEVGTAIVGLIGFSLKFSDKVKVEFPGGFDTWDQLKVANRGGIVEQKVPTCGVGLECWISFDPISKDAIPRLEFEDKFRHEQRVLFYSACRNAKVAVKIGNKTFKQVVRVSDPNFIQTIALPAKGQVSMHSSCGVSVTQESVQTASSLEILNALIAQGKAIRDARN